MNAFEPESILITAMPMILIAGVFSVAPRTRRGLLFGLSVPVEFPDGPLGVRILRDFRVAVVLTALGCIALEALALSFDLPWLTIIAVLAQLAAIFAFWVIGRGRIKPYAIENPVVRSASLGLPRQHFGAWMALQALAFAPIAGAWLYLREHWDEIPARFPSHWDLNGVANGYSNRGFLGVHFPLLLGALILALIFAIAIFMKLAPGVDRERMIPIMLPSLTAIAWILSAEFCCLALLPVSGHGLESSYLWITIGVLVSVAAVVVWMIRRISLTQGQERSDGTADRAWHAAGLVYYNPSDAAIVVPKRFGWGWTLNFARPVAWVYLAVVLAFVVGVMLLTSKMQ